MLEEMNWNICQTPIEKLDIDKYPDEIKEQFFDFINNVPYIKELIKGDRLYAKDIERDESGKIKIDLTKPHILEDMDYFRPSALHFMKTGRYTDLRPNPNPNSEYGKWFREELRRCYEGYVRESDGEWITGDYYFMLNYCPMLISKNSGKGKASSRVIGFPDVWEGHYYKSHYLNIARNNGHHAAELASRGRGKSYYGAAMLAKRFLLGESIEVSEKVTCYITATDKTKLLGGDQTLDKFKYDIDFCARNTQFPSKRLIDTLNNMLWVSGYKDVEGRPNGTQNSVVGKSSNDDVAKLRGSRGVLYLFEECGSFKNLIEIYNNLRPSVEDGPNVFGMLFLFGTAGDKDSDFSSAQEIMYNPIGYNVQELKNIYDKEGQGRPLFTFFFPGYMNRAECYDKDGNSDVTRALLEILKDRYTVKYNTTDINSITKRIAEIPVTPQEAMLRSMGNIFPVTQLNERLNQIDINPNFFDDVYVGDVVQKADGEIKFIPTDNKPIRDFPLKSNSDGTLGNLDGAVEIFTMPEKNTEGKVFSDRYIAGLDPVEDDAQSSTLSLMSFFILDLWTDRIVCEWTGRTAFTDDGYERIRKLLLFYNARCLYENNKKGIFSYFSMKNCLYLLADVPEYLRDKELIKGQLYGNKAKGFNATLPVNNYANTLIKNWLIKPVPEIRIEDGQEVEYQSINLFYIKSRALLKELVLFNPQINVDRIRALGALMLYREEKMILYQGNFKNRDEDYDADYLGNDDFFKKNYDDRAESSLWSKNKNRRFY